MKNELSWQAYVLTDYSFTEFVPKMFVLDVGCGYGRLVEDLERVGCNAIGLDPSRESVAKGKERGLKIFQARGENIPVKDRSIDGVVCRGVLMYTDEARAFGEMKRVLKKEGVCRISYHGVGYYLRHVLFFPSWKAPFYGLRTLVNTWIYAITGRRLPGFLGDTTYQTRSRLARHYRNHGFRLLEEVPSRKFLGFPVFIYHSIQKVTG